MKNNTPIKEAFNGFNKAYKDGIVELRKLLRNNNNFIATSDRGADAIFAYDVWDGEIKELFVEAIRLVDGTNIEIYLRQNHFADTEWNWDEHTDDEWDTYWDGNRDGYWISLEHSEVLCVFTLYNILECVEEYI